MVWRITVADAANERIIWHGVTKDQAEVEALAAEAHRHDPALKIWIGTPFGDLVAYAGPADGNAAG